VSHAYGKSARLYDLFCRHKDYVAASRKLVDLIRVSNPSARSLLDVACGSGSHLQILGHEFEAEGLDLSPEMLELARTKNPGVTFHQGDLAQFQLARTYDVVICLFGSVGYVGTLKRLHRAIAGMAAHLTSGGLLIVEPWLSPQSYRVGDITADFLDEKELKAARMYRHELDGGQSVFNIEYLVGDAVGVHRFTERHALGLFTEAQYLEGFRRAGIEAAHADDDLFGYGLYYGIREA
jgi:SAM-dependent methyltransferase